MCLWEPSKRQSYQLNHPRGSSVWRLGWRVFQRSRARPVLASNPSLFSQQHPPSSIPITLKRTDRWNSTTLKSRLEPRDIRMQIDHTIPGVSVHTASYSNIQGCISSATFVPLWSGHNPTKLPRPRQEHMHFLQLAPPLLSSSLDHCFPAHPKETSPPHFSRPGEYTLHAIEISSCHNYM